MKTKSLMVMLLHALATTKGRLALGILLGISATLLTSCAGGYVSTDGGYYQGANYANNDYYGNSGPDLYIFGGDYGRGNDYRNYSRRGSYSRSSSYHGGGGSHNSSGGHSGGGHSGGHSGGSHGGRR